MIDLTGIEPSAIGVLPAGKYVSSVTNVEIKTTSAGTGKYLKVEFTIAEGDKKNSKVWHNFNFENPNEVAVKIGKEQLVSLCGAVGVTTGNFNPEVLLAKNVGITTKIQKSEQYGDSAVVAYFFEAAQTKPESTETIPF